MVAPLAAGLQEDGAQESLGVRQQDAAKVDPELPAVVAVPPLPISKVRQRGPSELCTAALLAVQLGHAAVSQHPMPCT